MALTSPVYIYIYICVCVCMFFYKHVCVLLLCVRFRARLCLSSFSCTECKQCFSWNDFPSLNIFAYSQHLYSLILSYTLSFVFTMRLRTNFSLYRLFAFIFTDEVLFHTSITYTLRASWPAYLHYNTIPLESCNSLFDTLAILSTDKQSRRSSFWRLQTVYVHVVVEWREAVASEAFESALDQWANSAGGAQSYNILN